MRVQVYGHNLFCSHRSSCLEVYERLGGKLLHFAVRAPQMNEKGAENWCRVEIVEEIRKRWLTLNLFLSIFDLFGPARNMSKSVDNI